MNLPIRTEKNHSCIFELSQNMVNIEYIILKGLFFTGLAVVPVHAATKDRRKFGLTYPGLVRCD